MTADRHRRFRRAAIGRTPALVMASIVAGALLLGVLVIIGPMLTSGGNGNGNQQNANNSTIDQLEIPDDPSDDPTIVVEEGMETDGIVRNMERAHIEIADENGQLNQIFEYDRLDTLPDGFNEVTRPSVVAVVSETTLLRITAKQARVTMIEQRPQSGVLEGDVVIELFEGQSIRQPIAADARPTLQITTDTLSFDAALYRAETDDRVVFRSPNLGLAGAGLSIVYNEIEQRIESLELEHTEHIVYRAPTTDDNEADVTSTSRAPSPSDDAVATNRTNATTATTTARNTSADQPDTATPTSAEITPAPQTWYTLDLDEDVRIVRGEPSTKDRIEITGDHLTAWFSLNDDEWDAMLGHATPPRHQRFAPAPARFTRDIATRVAQELAGLSLANITSQPGSAAARSTESTPLLDPSDQRPDDVIITCAGRLRIAPVTGELPSELEGPGDLMATIDGTPTRVQLELGYATCANLAYHRTRNVVEMAPGARQIVDIVVPDFGSAQSDDPDTRFVIDFNQSTARMVGPGNALTDDGDETNTIAWNDKFELRFEGSGRAAGGTDGGTADDTDLGEIESAHFAGNVQVQTPDATIDANDTVEAFFVRPEPDADPVLQRIRAHGAVVAESSEGRVTGDTAVITLVPSESGDPIVESAEVIGNARMTDGEQSLRARRILATFARLADDPAADPDVSHVTASDRVVMDLQDGARVFADQLDADFPTDQVILSGSRVLAHVQDAIIFGSQITIDRAFSETGMLLTVPGAGTFAYLESTDPSQPEWAAPDLIIQAIERRMTKRHDADADADLGQALRVTWSDAMTYTVDSGIADVLGGVLAEGSAAPNEYDTIEAHRLIIELSEDANDGTWTGAETQIAAMAGERTLRRLEAYGTDDVPAAIFAGRYHDHTRRHPEMQLSIRGPFIEYTHATNRLDVHGAGSMLVVDKRTRDEAQADGSEPSAAPAEGVASFSGRGETLFKWAQDMSLDGIRNELRMHGDITLLHRPPNEGVTRLTAQTLNAGMLSDGPVDAFNLSQRPDMKLKFAMAEGSVVVISPEHEIMCDTFAYDAVSLLATIEATGEDLVTMVERGSPTPIRAGRIIWDLYTDSIKVDRVGTVFAPTSSGGG